MPRPCEVKGCEASCLSRRVTHRLPSKEPYRTLWLQAIGRTEEGLSKTASICSDHFEPSSYAVKCNRGARLKYDAVPTLFLTEAETVQRAAELNSRQIAPSTNKLRPLAMKPSELSFRPSTTNKLRPLAMRPTGAPNAVVPAELVPITLVPSVAVRVGAPCVRRTLRPCAGRSAIRRPAHGAPAGAGYRLADGTNRCPGGGVSASLHTEAAADRSPSGGAHGSTLVRTRPGAQKLRSKRGNGVM
ncbi:hypothetical protein HPB47_000960 [Ixodes persulcatus]|uniref:Uncharacterized protein n=1 Tax=Ixodes persulcatus TaxID=34615 RepID=A0AC60PRV8_IXOPE|nr:hypothetical protein HPB47_000960 [Ixodes persulcatus]